LLATAWGGDIGLTAAAMSPCMQLYAYLAEELTSSNIPNNPYSDWISTYSSQDFVTLVRQLITLVNTYTTDSTLARSTYRYAMLCERNFFQSAWTA
jgi:thiaminase (transcriptional activator TenA)